jgi:[ribosomal protein S18]-alanine N-acetyltransferase
MKLQQEIVIRPMRPDDIPRVRAIADALPLAPHWPLAAYLVALNPAVQPRRILLAAANTETGAVLGFAIASVVPPQAELETIAVAAEAQRSGVGRRLFAVLAAELRSAHVTEVTLEVRDSNYPALELYRALGFGEAGRRPRYYADPEEDAVLLMLALR